MSCAGERLQREPPEVEPLAPADDRGRHLVRLGGGQHEPHAGRRLLEDLQQRVERLAGQALRLVDDVDLLATLHRRGGRLLAQLAGVLDPAVAGRVDLDDVEVRALADRDALRAHAARLGRGPLLAVDHLGEDARGRGLARAPRPAEQERVVQAALADRAGERADHVVLPEHLLRASAAGTAGTGPGAASRPPRARLRCHGPPTRTPEDEKVAVHPPSTTDDSGASWSGSSSQASLRHPPASAYGCFLPDLTGFAGRCRAGPDLQRSVPRAAPDLPGLGRGFSPAEADRGYRAPLAPRLARPRGEYTQHPGQRFRREPEGSMLRPTPVAPRPYGLEARRNPDANPRSIPLVDRPRRGRRRGLHRHRRRSHTRWLGSGTRGRRERPGVRRLARRPERFGERSTPMPRSTTAASRRWTGTPTRIPRSTTPCARTIRTRHHGATRAPPSRSNRHPAWPAFEPARSTARCSTTTAR